jgi:hypothetical protein
VFGRRDKHSLTPPDLSSDPEGREVLRMWVKPEWSQVEVALQTAHPDPAAWGIALVDIARHAAKAYALNGKFPEDTALARIKQAFDAEWTSPTYAPTGRLAE